jgi:hypothetical protein
MGLISSRKGQYESKVWLNSIPKGILLKNQSKPTNILNLIIRDIENIKDDEIMGLYQNYTNSFNQSGQTGTVSGTPLKKTYTHSSLNFIYLLLLYIRKKGCPQNTTTLTTQGIDNLIDSMRSEVGMEEEEVLNEDIEKHKINLDLVYDQLKIHSDPISVIELSDYLIVDISEITCCINELIVKGIVYSPISGLYMVTE